MTAGGDAVALRIAAFARMLRSAGLEVGTARVMTALDALGAVDIARRDDVYWALRCALVSRNEDGAAFDAAFEAFWERRAHEPVMPAAPPVTDDDQAPAASRERRRAPEQQPGEAVEDGPAERTTVASEHERLQTLDFRAYDEEDLRKAREILERAVRRLPRRRSRRLRPAGDGRHLDARATVRHAMRHAGHPLERRWRAPKEVPRRLVFLVDISGSMEPYARATLLLLRAMVATGAPVDAFAFGTRLTRLTAHLANRDVDEALRRAAAAVPDWAGGTRIGDNLRGFNDIWGRRAVTRGAVVVIVSDGWERGDVGELTRAMWRLRLTSHTLIWVNPLTGDPEFEPLAAGMVAALPHVDLFLPGHDLRSLTGLLDVLGAVAARRAAGVGRPVSERSRITTGAP